MRFDRVYDANEEWLWGELQGETGVDDLRLIRALCILGGFKVGINWAAPESKWLIAPNGAYELIVGNGKDADGYRVD